MTTHNTQSAQTHIDINTLEPIFALEMARTAAELLNIDPQRRNIALLMDCPITMTNVEAIAQWISDFMPDQLEHVDFINAVLPSLVHHLNQCRCQLQSDCAYNEGIH